MNKALFITLDNVLIHTKSGRKYPLHSKDWILNIEVLDVIKHFYNKKYKLIIIDNQQAVADGYMHKDVFLGKIHDIIDTTERAINITTKPISYMFWVGDRDDYYKLSNPGLIYECALEYELDLPNSFLLGDLQRNYEYHLKSTIGGFIDVDKLINEDYKNI